jgi:hypothetical protein
MSIDSGKSDSWLAVKVRVFWADSMLQAILPKPIHHSKTDHEITAEDGILCSGDL